MVHPVKLGKNTRMSYGKINEVLDMPNLIEIQINSYNWFLEEGLKEAFEWYRDNQEKVGKRPYFAYIDEHLV